MVPIFWPVRLKGPLGECVRDAQRFTVPERYEMSVHGASKSNDIAFICSAAASPKVDEIVFILNALRETARTRRGGRFNTATVRRRRFLALA